MRSNHFIDLEEEKSPSFKDDIDFFMLMFNNIFGILSNSSDISGWNSKGSITSINQFKSIGDIQGCKISDGVTCASLEIDYDEWNCTYSIDINIPDKFNYKNIDVVHANPILIEPIMVQYFPNLKLPKKAKNNVKTK